MYKKSSFTAPLLLFLCTDSPMVLMNNWSYAPHIHSVLGQGARLVEAEHVDRSADVYRPRTNAVDTAQLKSPLGEHYTDSHCCRQRWRNYDRNEVKYLNDGVVGVRIEHYKL